MATFYFNGAADLAAELPTDWQTLGNWWMDNTFTTPATSLPTSADDVIASENIWANSGSEPTVANFTLNDPANAYLRLNIPITVTDTATFNDSSYNYGTVTGDCVFNDAAGHAGAISGNCIFNDNSFTTFWASFNGAITGDCTFNDNSYCNSNITGNCVFNDNAYCGIMGMGTVQGDCEFNGNAQHYGHITGDCIFNGTCGVNTTFVSATVEGNCTFNDDSFNNGTITGDCTFNHNSRNEKYVVGYATFNDYSYNRVEWLPDYSAMTKSGAVFKSAVFNDYSANEGQVSWGATFNHNSRNGSAIFWSGVGGGGIDPPGGPLPRPAEEVATFNDSSYFLQGSLYIGSFFNHSSYFTTEYGGSLYVTPVFQNRTPYPIPRGINGSSILGVV